MPFAPEFLFSFVRHESFVEALADLVKGALYPAVNDRQVRAGDEELETINLLPAALLRQAFIGVL